LAAQTELRPTSSDRRGGRLTVGCPVATLLDARLLAWTFVWGMVTLLVLGLATAIIPNPVFGRQIPPEPFAMQVWLLSAPLMGLVMATYMVPARPIAVTINSGPKDTAKTEPGARAIDEDARGGTLGTIGGIGVFLAIGCPVCNKIALVLLGTSGALSVYAPVQPWIGTASLILLVVTAGWRLRLRARGGACSV
jgi:hypothetical protein